MMVRYAWRRWSLRERFSSVAMDIFSAEPAGGICSSYDQMSHSSWMLWLFIGFLLSLSNFYFQTGPSFKCVSKMQIRNHWTSPWHWTVPHICLSPSPQNPTKSKMPNETQECETLELFPPQGQNKSSGEIQPQPAVAVAENFHGVQSKQQPPKSGTQKALKRVTWRPSVQKWSKAMTHVYDGFWSNIWTIKANRCHHYTMKRAINAI